MIRPLEHRERVPTPLFPAVVHGTKPSDDDVHIPRRLCLQPTVHGTFIPSKLDHPSRRARNDQRIVNVSRVFHRRVLQGLQLWFAVSRV